LSADKQRIALSENYLGALALHQAPHTAVKSLPEIAGSGFVVPQNLALRAALEQHLCGAG
jgi:hypothetical protein